MALASLILLSFDKLLYICLIWIKETIDKERGIVCSHGNVEDLNNKKPAQIRFHSNSLESVGQRPLPLGQRKRN